MAVNALGLPLQLQASSQQLQDLLGGLKPGDMLKGRLIEVLPEGKAVLNLRGQNLVAQLPAGLNPAKGTVLPLQVTQLAPADTGKAASLTLRLLPTLLPTEAPLSSQPPSLPSATIQAQVDQALGAARLPSTPVSQQVARTLAQLGVPLTPLALQNAVQAVNSLLGAEAPAPASVPAAPAAVQPLQNALEQVRVAAQLSPPGPANLVLQQAVRELQAALQNAQAPTQPASPPLPVVPGPATAPAPSAPPPPGLSGPAVSSPISSTMPLPSAGATQAFIQNPPLVSSPLPAPPPAHLAFAPPSAPVAAQAPAQIPAQASVPGPNTGPAPASPPIQSPAPAAALQQAVTHLLAQPAPAALQALQTAVQAVLPPAQASPSIPVPPARVSSSVPTASGQSLPPILTGTSAPPAQVSPPAPSPMPAPSSGPSTLPSPGATAPAPSTAIPVVAPEPSLALVQRETVAPLLTLAAQPGPAPNVETVRQAVALQAQALEFPASLPAQRLLQSVQTQFPQAQPEGILQNARQALAQVQAQLAGLPPAQPMGLPALQQVLGQAQVTAPRVPLQSLPVETVAEAVAWLQARDLPPQRPLVEAVAVFLQQDHNALPAAQRALTQAAGLDPAFLGQRPALSAAIQDARHALDQATLRPETPDLAGRLQVWATRQGLDLEAALARAEARPTAEAAAPAPHPGLRPALQRLEQQLRLALQDPQARPAETTAALQASLAETQSAGRALSAVPLQVQGAPAYDTVHMPLPVMMGQDLGGRLSVTWRHGRDRQLDDKEPVSVAVALNTGSLGTVKVLLQVWKDAASARVLAESPETADFLAEGADELKAGFAERTPFKLQALDFAAAADLRQGSGPLEVGPEAGRSRASGEGWSA